MIGTVLQCIAFLSNQKDGDFEVKRYFPKRSKAANAYYWALVEQITEVRQKDDPNVTKGETHRTLLNDYGSWEKNEDGSAKWVIFPKDKPLPIDGYYWDAKTEVTVKGQNSGEEIGRLYMVVKGSHNYDSKEMKALIDGTVQEAKNLGIETRTPAEIEQMIAEMGEA